MQFIFGSDNNGYGIRYAEDREEAAAVRQNVDLSISDFNPDYFGFMPFGTNANRPMFFKIKKDINYSRNAYYLHAIYQKASSDVYNFKRLKDDMFAEFIHHGWMDECRAGNITVPEIKTDPEIVSVMNRVQAGELPNIPEETCIEILATLLNDERVNLSITDDVYSIAYARYIMALLFSYLPGMVIKSCSFVIGLANTTDFRICILPQSRISEVSGTNVINVTEQNRACRHIDKFTDIAKLIVNISNSNEVSLDDMYAAYGKLYSIEHSRYKPGQFLKFMRAFINKDPESADELLDDLLAESDDPSPEDVPDYIREAVKNKGIDMSHAKKYSADELWACEDIFKKNATFIKKLYVLDEEYLERYVNIIYEPLREIIISLENGKELTRKIDEYAATAKNKKTKVRSSFYNALDRVIRTLSERVASFDRNKVDIVDKISAFIKGKLEDRIYTDVEYRRDILPQIQQLVASNRATAQVSGFDFDSVITQTLNIYVQKHNQRVSEKEKEKEREKEKLQYNGGFSPFTDPDDYNFAANNYGIWSTIRNFAKRPDESLVQIVQIIKDNHEQLDKEPENIIVGEAQKVCNQLREKAKSLEDKELKNIQSMLKALKKNSEKNSNTRYLADSILACTDPKAWQDDDSANNHRGNPIIPIIVVLGVVIVGVLAALYIINGGITLGDTNNENEDIGNNAISGVYDSTETDSVETDSVETESTETDSVETDSTETDSVETDSTETDSVETDSVETESTETDSVETDSVETESTETDSVETDSVETDSTETDSVETDSTETDSVETESTETDSVEIDSVETESIETNSTETNTNITELVQD